MSGLSVSIMGHESRMPFIRELQEQLPTAELVLDRKNDRWDTGRRALLAHVDTGSDFALVVQDDAILCRDLVPGALQAAEAAGERPVALYTGKVRPHQRTITPAYRSARAKGLSWLAFEGPWWGVGIVVPTAHIPDLVAWGDRHPRIANYDKRIAAFYARQKIDCWYTVPSLVDHRPVAENPSLIDGRTGNRRAHWFIGEDSPLDIDWSLPPHPLSATFQRRGRRVAAPFGSPRFRRLSKHPEWEEIAA